MVDSSNPNFDLAKKQVIHGLEKLARFSSNMDENYPTCGFAQFVQKLTDLESLTEAASGTCLSCNQIDEIEINRSTLVIKSVFYRQLFYPSWLTT
jgi:hypothetical protein